MVPLHHLCAIVQPNIKKIQSGAKDIFLHIAQSPAYTNWLGHAFEHLCYQHAWVISKILGFSGVSYTTGPYFRLGRKEQSHSVEIDLLFDRADHVITLCEMKYTRNPVSIDVITEMEQKIARFPNPKKKTIQKVLITFAPPTRELAGSGYFYRIILAEELIHC